MPILKKLILFFILTAPIALAIVTAWLAYPTASRKPLPPQLRVATADSWTSSPYAKKASTLVAAYEPQTYISYCGPASLATVLRAYGAKADQRTIFPSIGEKLRTFYSGTSLKRLSTLATEIGLQNEVVHLGSVTFDQFKQRVKSNLATDNAYVLINYNRKGVGQSSGGHISPIASYDEVTDSFLVLDEAGYKYPFTWIPAQALFDAARTLDGDDVRGILLIDRYSPPQ